MMALVCAGTLNCAKTVRQLATEKNMIWYCLLYLFCGIFEDCSKRRFLGNRKPVHNTLLGFNNSIPRKHRHRDTRIG